MSSYKVSEPSALKFLKENGAVVDENGNVISEATDYWKKVYDQAEPKPAKYLHADGTIDENPGSGGGADLEDNHEATIDVSAYTEPVEIEPAQGKDGMKKATVTLSNIPAIEATKQTTIDVSTYDPANKPVITPTAGKQSMAEVEVTLDNIPSGGGSVYAWVNLAHAWIFYTSFEIAPEAVTNEKELFIQGDYIKKRAFQPYQYKKISDTSFATSNGEVPYVRDATKDFPVWG